MIENDCFIKPSGLYRYPSGPPPSESGSAPCIPSRFAFLSKPVPPRLPSISRYVRKLPDTLLALHDLPSVHLRIPASLSSHTKTDPDLIDCRSFSDSLRCTRGSRPMRHASKRMIASVGVRTCPLYVSIPFIARLYRSFYSYKANVFLERI